MFLAGEVEVAGSGVADSVGDSESEPPPADSVPEGVELELWLVVGLGDSSPPPPPPVQPVSSSAAAAHSARGVVSRFGRRICSPSHEARSAVAIEQKESGPSSTSAGHPLARQSVPCRAIPVPDATSV